MITSARFPEQLHVVSGGVYEFSTELSLGSGAAYVLGPAPESCPGKLAAIGEQLVRFATADPQVRAVLRLKILRDVAALNDALDD